MKNCAKFEEYIPGISLLEIARKYSEKIINLASNENPYGASPKAIKAFQSFADLHKYPDPSYKELRERLSEYTGWDFKNIVVGAGSDGILEAIFRFAVSEGDEVLLAPPTFQYYRILAKLSCAKIVECRRNENFEIANASELITEKTKLSIFCSPNNPTGNLENFEEIRAVAESSKGLVVVDEAYVEFADKKFSYDYENVLILRTFSKAFGLANLRIGYAKIPDEYLKFYKSASTPFPISTAAERAAIASLEDLDWVKNCVENIKRSREELFKFLSRKFKTYPSQANFILVKAKDLHIELAKRGILVRECSSFGLPNHIRISVGREEENKALMEAIECLSP